MMLNYQLIRKELEKRFPWLLDPYTTNGGDAVDAVREMYSDFDGNPDKPGGQA